MAGNETQQQSSPDWLKPSIEPHSLRQYLTTLRQRAWVVVLVMLVTTGAAAAYVSVAEERYEAEADVLVTPVPGDDRVLRGLGLISSSADPEREIETVARLISARNVEDRVGRRLEKIDVDEVTVTAAPLAESNIVTITAEAPTRRAARRAANGFARTAIDIRSEQFQRQLDQAITTLEAQITGAEKAGALPPAGELARLKALRGRPDPTLRLEVEADNPSAATWPRPAASIAVGALVGLILGVGAVFLWQLLDPRLRREEDLKEMFGLPILARIPAEPTRFRRRGALTPDDISAQTLEAFRGLRFTLIAAQESLKGGGSLFVTGASPSEGKTTTCINLATSLASMGQKVILIEADLRRPAIGEAGGLAPDPHGVAGVIVGRSSMEDALIEAEGLGGNLSVLLADEQGEWLADQLSLPAAQHLVSEAEKLADFVIIDSPPVIDVTDTLPLASEADEVLLVVRLGKSRIDELSTLGEMLAAHGIRPLGIVLVGVSRGRSDYYYTGKRRKRTIVRETPVAEKDIAKAPWDDELSDEAVDGSNDGADSQAEPESEAAEDATEAR